MRLPLLVLPSAVLLNSACTERPAPLAAGPGPLAIISDGSTGGNSHFFFLAPMLPEAGTAGANDESLSPRVVICAYEGTCSTILATYTMDLSTTTTTQEGNSETVRLSTNHFIVDWHTDAFGLNPALTYRVCVYVGDKELGYADVDVAASGRELRVGVDGYVSVLDGRTLPIRFRIEAGALDLPGTNGCESQPT